VALALGDLRGISLSGVDITWRCPRHGLVLGPAGEQRLRQLPLRAGERDAERGHGHYLNTRGNQKENPRHGPPARRNYAREVMQLFTIGLVELNIDGTPEGRRGQAR
jgi:hypothetical protein